MRIMFLITTQEMGKKVVDTFSSFNEIAIMKVKLMDKRYPFHKNAQYSGIYLLLDSKNKIVASDTMTVER